MGRFGNAGLEHTHTNTATTTVDNLKVNTRVSTDNPLGVTLGGSGVNTLGDLMVSGTALITRNLTVNGNLSATNVYAKDQIADKLLEMQGANSNSFKNLPLVR